MKKKKRQEEAIDFANFFYEIAFISVIIVNQSTLDISHIRSKDVINL